MNYVEPEINDMDYVARYIDISNSISRISEIVSDSINRDTHYKRGAALSIINMGFQLLLNEEMDRTEALNSIVEELE